MRRLVFDVGSGFVRHDTAIVDLGCSRGEALAPFVEAFGTSNRYVGVDVSGPMLDACRTRFGREIGRGALELFDLDLRDGYPDARASLTLAVLTLQFIPIEHRPRVVREAYDHTVDGGAFVLVEKVRAGSARTDRLMTGLHHGFKQTNGYGAVFRLIPTKIATLDQLGIPPVVKQFGHLRGGLVLVTGPTGSGKSTTLAALIDYINQNFSRHIVTIEEPIEFVHGNKRSIITQREVPVDCISFPDGLKAALREDAERRGVGEGGAGRPARHASLAEKGEPR